MARDTPDESVPLELIVPGNNVKRGSLVSGRFIDLDGAEGLSNGHSNVPVHKPLKIKNLISKGEAFDTLHQNSVKVIRVCVCFQYYRYYCSGLSGLRRLITNPPGYPLQKPRSVRSIGSQNSSSSCTARRLLRGAPSPSQSL